MRGLDGKVALVAGGGSGIGAATAVRLAEEGTSGVGGAPPRPSYSRPKGGLRALSRHVAQRWGKEGIRANVVAPGYVITEGVLARGHTDLQQQVLAACPSPRLGRSEDIAAAVAFLLSDD